MHVYSGFIHMELIDYDVLFMRCSYSHLRIDSEAYMMTPLRWLSSSMLPPVIQ